MNNADVQEAVNTGTDVILVHIPTGCHIHTCMSTKKKVNRAAAYRLLERRLIDWETIKRS